jgi:hypothetical protein
MGIDEKAERVGCKTSIADRSSEKNVEFQLALHNGAAGQHTLQLSDCRAGHQLIAGTKDKRLELFLLLFLKR